MSEAASLVARARERQGITVEQLGIRAGFSPAFVSDVEAGGAEPTPEQLADLLLVCGLQLERSDAGRLTVRRSSYSTDPQEIAAARQMPPGERLAHAIGWNSFADEVFQAGRRLRGQQ